MQRCIAVTVSIIQTIDPAKQINKSDLSLWIGCPVKCCTPSVVSTVHIKSSKLKEVDCSGLVSLGSNMKHIDTKIVFRMDICPLQNEELAHIRVSSEGGKVEGSEAIAMVLLINPVC